MEGMDVVELLVGAQGVHVGIDAPSGTDTHLRELQPFPFGEGMYDLCPGVSHVLYGEGYRPLGSVEVVVQS